MNRIVSLFAGLTFIFGPGVFAQSASELHTALSAEAASLRVWGSDKAIVEAVRHQNATSQPFEEIQRLDREWIAGGQAELKKTITTAPCADRLRELATDGVHGEMFVTDSQGALVCASTITSDYYQGDEPKFANAFKGGEGAVFIDRPRFDESSGATIAHISIPIVDGQKTIGVLVVGVSVSKIARR